MKYILKNDRLEVEIDSLGAELVSVKLDGRERLWQNESGVWSGHAPILFPFAGACKVIVDGEKYPEHRRHGFGRLKEFALVNKSEDSICLALSADTDTLEYYPYYFTLLVEYSLGGSSVEIRTIMKNTDDKTLYYSIGGHESYALGKSDHIVRFPEDESFDTLLADNNGHMTGEIRHLGEGNILDLKPEYLAGGNTLIFSHLNSTNAELCRADGTPVARTEFDGFPYFLIWSPDGADMVCLEPWMNLPDNAVDEREISDKGFIKVDAGDEHITERTITYC